MGYCGCTFVLQRWNFGLCYFYSGFRFAFVVAFFDAFAFLLLGFDLVLSVCWGCLRGLPLVLSAEFFGLIVLGL